MEATREGDARLDGGRTAASGGEREASSGGSLVASRMGLDVAAVLPALGFGSFLFIADNVNAPMLLVGVEGAAAAGGGRILDSLVPFALTIALFAVLVRRRSRPAWSTPVMLVSAGVICACYAVRFLAPDMLGGEGAAGGDILGGPALLGAVLECASFLCRAALFYHWVVALLPLGSRRFAGVFALSLCFYAAMSLLSMLAKEFAAQMLLAVMPLLSAACLQVFYLRCAATCEADAPLRDEIAVQAQECLGRRGTGVLYGASVLLPCFFGSAILAVFYQIWTSGPEGADQPVAAQVGLVVGALAMAAFTLVLVARFWSYINLQAVGVFVPLLLVAMLWVSLSEPSWVFVYFAIMFIVQKSLLILGLYAPYMFRVGFGGGPGAGSGKAASNWAVPWCAAFLVFQLGGFVGSALLENLAPGAMDVVLAIFVAAMGLGVLFAFLFHGMKITEANEGYASGRFRNEGRYRAAVKRLADDYALTAREQDILVELGRGRNAEYAAERLVISPQTIKTHQKSIYTKMGLHSQQELIALIDRAISEL